MNTSAQLLRQIRRESLTSGLPAALLIARAAVDDGRIGAPEVPEVLFALRTGDWQCLLSATADLAGTNECGAQAA